jgi:hypothetical protein
VNLASSQKELCGKQRHASENYSELHDVTTQEIYLFFLYLVETNPTGFSFRYLDSLPVSVTHEICSAMRET